MDSRLVLGMLLVGACKTELADLPLDGGNGIGSDGNGTLTTDAGTTTGDGSTVLGAWSMPAKIPGADSASAEDDVVLSTTRLELYFKRNDTDANLYVMTRQTTSSQWSNPAPVTVLNTTADEESPRLADNDLTMYFGRGGDIFKATRAAIGMPWEDVQAVTALNTTAYEKWGVVCSNGYAMVSRAVANQGQDIFEGTITAGTNTSVAVLNSVAAEQGIFLTPDCLRVYYQSNRDNNQFNIYMSTRNTTQSPWSNPTTMTDFNTATFSEEDPWLSADERTFVYCNNSSGNKDLYISTR
jgi:hypothetical protein